MTEAEFFPALLAVWTGLAVVAFIGLFFLTVPYGRHSRSGWGITIDPRIGWVFMESASSLGFLAWFILGEYSIGTVPIAFLLMWELHYVYRAFVYPFRAREHKNRMPLLIALFAFLFNCVNSYINSRYLFTLSGGYALSWIWDARFIVGFVLFFIGLSMNWHADQILIKLHQSGTGEYGMPEGGCFRWLSCPNYLGEIIEWTGWAVATWSLPGLIFMFWTIANLTPRARSNHLWYRARFPEYPPNRKALIPFIW